MKNLKVHYNNQYYNNLSKSRFSSRTSRRLKSERGDYDLNDTRTRFYHRLEKACTTFSSNDLNKQINLYRKEIERLEKENLKKDKIIFQIKETTMHNKEIEAELIEVYRVLYLYEGKITEYEKELKRLERTIASKAPQDLTLKVEELLESYRLDNSELNGKIEEKNKIILEMEAKIKKIENKYFSTAWKLSTTKREITNPLKKRFPNLRNTITLNQTPLLQKQKAMRLNQAKTTGNFPRNQYQITVEDTPREKEAIRFKKVESSPNNQDYIRTTFTQHGDDHIRRSVSNNSPTVIANSSTRINSSSHIPLQSTSQANIYYSNAKPSTNYFAQMKNQSNTNITSRVISNDKTIRVETVNYRQESPKTQGVEQKSYVTFSPRRLINPANNGQVHVVESSGYQSRYSPASSKDVANYGQSTYQR